MMFNDQIQADIRADSTANVHYWRFKIPRRPEALTQWKMRMLAHSTTMQTGYLEHSITTSKKVMVQPNMPRFLRQGDAITIASKIIIWVLLSGISILKSKSAGLGCIPSSTTTSSSAMLVSLGVKTEVD